jgi:hypothetical protein
MIRFLLLLLFCSGALAQTPYLVVTACLPAADPLSTKASPPSVRWNDKGVCVKWTCYLDTFTPTNQTATTTVTYCGTWAIQNLVGSRLQTIQRAADPLKSLQDAGKRFTMVPLTDPSMSGMPRD